MSDPTFKLTTPRLTITHLLPTCPAHCEFLVTLYNTPEFLASIGGVPTAITTPAAARDRIAGRLHDEHLRNGYGTYLVSLRPVPTDSCSSPSSSSSSTEANNNNATKNTNSSPATETVATMIPIGTVSLTRGTEPNCYGAPDLGFAILPQHTRRGYAREAALALLDYADRELGVRHVLGLFDPANEASEAVFRSIGFEDRGRRVLRVFGGVVGAVWARPGMDPDLSVYGLPTEDARGAAAV